MADRLPQRRAFANGQELGQLFDRLPPHSIEAEMGVLGSLILAGTEAHGPAHEVFAMLSTADFYLPKHAAIFDVARDCWQRNDAMDSIQLTEALRERGQFEQVGGVEYLVELAEAVPTAINAPHYAGIVRDRAVKRQLAEVCGDGLRRVYESTEHDAAADVAEAIEQRMYAVVEQGKAQDHNTDASMAELVSETMERMERAAESGIAGGLRTGLNELDDLIVGMMPGDLIVLAARPSIGKSALALAVQHHVSARWGRPSVLFSLEMSRQQIGERALALDAGVSFQKLRRNMLSADELERIQASAEALPDAPLHVAEAAGCSIGTIRARARRLAREHAIELIAVDYLQLVTAQVERGDGKRIEIGEVSRGLKAMAQELGVPVLALSQLNRASAEREDKRPRLNELRESGSIEQDADVVLLLHREEVYHPNEEWRREHPDQLGKAELIVAKQRNGPVGSVALEFDGPTMAFRDPAQAQGERAMDYAQGDFF